MFSFFTDPKKMIQWKGISAELTARPGGIYRVSINGRDVARGEYLEVVPFSRIVFTWGWEGDGSAVPPGSSTVEVTLAPAGDGTLLRLRHIGLPAPAQKEHSMGWEHYLARLAMAAAGKDPGKDMLSM